ncbi:MAG: outer membrane protein assembly factor BamD [Candidatus Omnitrophica bacterium]|nr:outer membrane protein assembly factor BamD [Candidatus Omnitrophota bacterium]
MRNKWPILLLFLFINTVILAPQAQAFWVWTPKTGRFVNPKHAVKQNPKEQLNFALGFFNAGDYIPAAEEFKKLIKYYPKSHEASEAQFYLGECLMKQADFYSAYKAYQKVIDKYPFSERIQEIVEKEYAIAEKFISGEAERKALGLRLPVDNPAIEILEQIIENSTYGPLAPVAQYKLGLILKDLGRLYEAEEAFEKVANNYPASEWVAAARFQLASTKAATSTGPEYDSGAAGEAKKGFEDFLKVYPDAELSQKARDNITRIKDKEAQFNFDTARFYEKQKEYKAAAVYYKIVLDDYPDSKFASEAVERLSIIENMEGK